MWLITQIQIMRIQFNTEICLALHLYREWNTPTVQGGYSTSPHLHTPLQAAHICIHLRHNVLTLFVRTFILQCTSPSTPVSLELFFDAFSSCHNVVALILDFFSENRMIMGFLYVPSSHDRSRRSNMFPFKNRINCQTLWIQDPPP